MWLYYCMDGLTSSECKLTIFTRHDAASTSTSASPPTLCDELFICLLLAAGCWLATEVTATPPLLLLNQLNQFQAGNSSPGPCLATTGPALLQLHTGLTATYNPH